jgi:hypothetical protein
MMECWNNGLQLTFIVSLFHHPITLTSAIFSRDLPHLAIKLFIYVRDVVFDLFVVMEEL